MKKITYFLLTALFALTISPLQANSLWDDVKNDQKNFYQYNRLLRLGSAFLIAAPIANSRIDESIQRYYQNHIRNRSTNQIALISKQLGEAKYMVPIAIALSNLSYFDEDLFIADFGNKLWRSYLVGITPLLITQRLTGAGRPSNVATSKWNTFNRENGVSGHAFAGAAPFLIMAKMSENQYLKYTAYAASALTPLSRINDNRHYFSQVLLGWYLAYESTNAVFDTENMKEKSNIQIAPVIQDNFYGFNFYYSW